MFVLIWTTLLLFVRGYSADPGFWCYYGYCITLAETNITAVAGLCAVIPCSFTTGWGFTTTHLLWSTCEPDRKCTDSDIIFHTNKSNRKVQTEYKGRVSILEPDLSRGNCSIVINDLTESDSGSYQLRVNGVKNERQDGLNYPLRATVSVKGLTQKPTVMVPPLTEGQQSTLTCTAPGLCSGSEPEITWTWRGTGGNEPQVTGNITSNGRQSSLTFNPSAAHHGLEVTCRVSFTGDIRTEETVTLNVTWFSKILGSSGCEVESDVLTCVCISEGFPLPSIQWPSMDQFVITTVSNHTVKSTLIVKGFSNSVQCVSSHEVGEVKENLVIHREEPNQEGQHRPRALLPWVVAAGSFFLNVILIIYVLILRNARKKVPQNTEDRTYTSLKRTDREPDYGFIG